MHGSCLSCLPWTHAIISLLHGLSSTVSCCVAALGHPSDEEDLNFASAKDLVAAKRHMDTVFEQNLVKPGEAHYIHDLRKDFGRADRESDWDIESHN